MSRHGRKASSVRRAPGGGFTLIEAAVALAILALLSLLGYRALSTLLESQAQVTSATLTWERIDQIFARMEADLHTALPRPARVGEGTEPPLLLAGNGGDTLVLAFSRAGPEFAAEPTSAGQRIAYRWRRSAGAGVLELLYWPAFDVLATQPAQTFTLGDNIDEVRFRMLTSAGTWSDRWPLPGQPDLPVAVTVGLRVSNSAWLERLIVLR